MSTGKFVKKLISVENIKEERSEQLVRKAIMQMRPGNTAVITLLEKKWFKEVETTVEQLLALGTKETRKCRDYTKSTYSEKCVNCGRRVPAHEEEEQVRSIDRSTVRLSIVRADQAR